MTASEGEWATFKDAVADALEQPIGERAQLLKKRFPDRQRYVEAEKLLRSCERANAESFLSPAALEIASQLVAQLDRDDRVRHEALRSALGGRYEIVRELGRGGTATVFLARDERHDRPVALKVLRQELVADDAPSSGGARFQREIAIAARLSHPHILPLYDSGAAAGMLYYITPFAAGESLRDRLTRTGRLQLPNALRILRDVTRALAYAHRQGIVHRDIKPGNILLTEEGDALICDFGVAKAVEAVSEASASPSHEVTARGLILGTPAYIAPEQISDGQSVDHRADLYSLGVVAYEAFTGFSPFNGRSAHEQLAAHLAELPEPVCSRQPDVPTGIATVVDRLLAKRPADRPQHAEEVLAYIEAEMAGRPLPIAPYPDHATGSSEARELYVKGRFLFSTRQRDAMLGALQHFRQAVARDATFAPAHAGIADVCNLLGIFGHTRPHEIFPQARSAAERAIQLDPRLAEGHAALGHLLHAYEWNWSGAAEELERAIALNPRYPAARMYYGSYLHAMGRSRDALTQLEAARSIDPLAPVGMLTGRIHVDRGRPDLAIEVLRNELELDPRRDLAHQLLAHAFLQKGMHPEAIASMQRAAEMSGPRDIAQLAYIYAATGGHTRARQILEDLVGSSPQCRHLGFHLAMAHGELGEDDEAFACLEAAFEERGSFMVLLAVSTGFASLRRDPRFGRMLKRMGLDNAVRS